LCLRVCVVLRFVFSGSGVFFFFFQV